MDAQLRSLIIVLGLNISLLIVVITVFTCCKYYRSKNTLRRSSRGRSGDDGLLVDEDEKVEGERPVFVTSLNHEERSLSSESLTDEDGTRARRSLDRKASLPRLDPFLFKWIYQLYKISDRQVFKLTPADGYLYLFFLRGAAILFFVMTIVN